MAGADHQVGHTQRYIYRCDAERNPDGNVASHDKCQCDHGHTDTISDRVEHGTGLAGLAELAGEGAVDPITSPEDRQEYHGEHWSRAVHEEDRDRGDERKPEQRDGVGDRRPVARALAVCGAIHGWTLFR